MKVVQRRFAIMFCNGFRKRIVNESGGLEKLKGLFSYFLDASALMKPWESSRFDDVISDPLSLCIANFSQFEIFLREENPQYVLIVGAGGALGLKKIEKLIKRYKIKWGVLENRGDYARKFFERDAMLVPKKRSAFRNFRNKLFSRLPMPDHVFSNDLATKEKFLIDEKSFVFVNHRDYYLASCSKSCDMSKYFVFLDQSLPFHYSKHGKVAESNRFYDKNTKEKYYSTLNAYLEKIYFGTGLTPVICMHPNAPEGEDKNFSHFCHTVRGRTGDYIANADFLVTHNSSSTSYAYLYRKKVILLDFPCLLPKRVRESIKTRGEKERFSVQVWPSSYMVPPLYDSLMENKIYCWLVPVREKHDLVDKLKSILLHSVKMV